MTIDKKYPYGVVGASLAMGSRGIITESSQPPALGGEPEVLAWRMAFGPAVTELVMAESMRDAGHEVIELVDRAHVARLQAEVERLKPDSKKLAELDDSTIKQLADRLRVSEVRTAELEGLLRDALGHDIGATLKRLIDAALAEGAK